MNRSTFVRVLVALVVVVVGAAALWWGFLRDDAPKATASRVELDVARLQNGDAPSQFDTGQTAVIAESAADQGADLQVVDGKLTFAPTQDGPAAAFYGSPDMGHPVNEVGARWVFRPYGESGPGSVSLVVANGLKPATLTIGTPVPIQLVITPVNWNLNVKKDETSALEPIAAGTFDTPLLVDGTTAYDTTVKIEGSVVTLTLPDGERRTVNDARVSQWQGNYAIFGLYSNNGPLDSVGGFEKVWASAGGADQ